jgi:uncharacterized 2Fe-2S/4Fe-4S cluster protein (DUF4445 family)
VPKFLEIPVLQAKDLNIPVFSDAPVYVMPGVGGYLGADIVSGVMSAGIHKSEKLTLFIDLGTNGEILLGNRDWMTGCACSAGPAFEGAGMECGMRAAPGAIDKVVIKNRYSEPQFHVIGGNLPKGICGSGMIDLLWDLFKQGIIDRRGRFIRDDRNPRIRGKRGQREFLVCSRDKCAHNLDIVITAPDIENLIRTKGAVWSGIRTLLKVLGLNQNCIERVMVAGRLGRHCNLEKSIALGMLPDLPLERFSYVGDAALDGASLYLLSEDARDETHKIAHNITYIDLSSESSYMDEFVASLFIPHTERELFPSSEKLASIGK